MFLLTKLYIGSPAQYDVCKDKGRTLLATMLISIAVNSIRGAANTDLCLALLAVSAPVWKHPLMIPCSEMVVDDFVKLKSPESLLTFFDE